MSNFYLQYGKRIVDVVLSLIVVLLFSWLFALIFLAYLLTFNVPVFFSQERLGKHRRVFTMIKFRTLSSNHSLSLQERRFILGNILRATNLDELPQLWNVIKGDMSLVGPRPLPVEYQSEFSGEQDKRHQVLPGVTGLAQISGKNSIPWSRKLELDVAYVSQRSFRLDCLILLKTVTLVLSMQRDVSLDEEKFSG